MQPPRTSSWCELYTRLEELEDVAETVHPKDVMGDWLETYARYLDLKRLEWH